METAPEPAAPGSAQASGRAADPADPGSPEKPGKPRPGERGRLRPPPAPTHAPLLLGIDPAGREHPQSPADPDDESLVGRCWGCVCGWRGPVRDVATRHFHPRVGDGGGLRRRRLARADRDARAELEHHLAAATATPPAPAAPTAPVATATGSTSTAPAAPNGAAPRRRRRRLTLPRTISELDPPDATSEPEQAAEPHRDEPPRPPLRPAPEPLPTAPPGPPSVEEAADASRPAPDVTDPDPEPGPDLTGGRARDRAHEPFPTGTPSAGVGEDELAAAAERARSARAELAAAESALDAVVAAARAAGASWRTIARATGVPHRDAAARWDPAGAGPSL